MEEKYILSDSQRKLLAALEERQWAVHFFRQDGNVCAEVEDWTDGGVDMILTLMPFSLEEFEKRVKNFDVDEEIETHRQGEDYREAFSYRRSVEDFEAFEKRLDEDLDFIEKKLDDISVEPEVMKFELTPEQLELMKEYDALSKKMYDAGIRLVFDQNDHQMIAVNADGVEFIGSDDFERDFDTDETPYCRVDTNPLGSDKVVFADQVYDGMDEVLYAIPQDDYIERYGDGD